MVRPAATSPSQRPQARTCSTGRGGGASTARASRVRSWSFSSTRSRPRHARVHRRQRDRPRRRQPRRHRDGHRRQAGAGCRNVAFGSEAGVGASAVILVRNGTVDAAIHQGADIQSNGGSGLAARPRIRGHAADRHRRRGRRHRWRCRVGHRQRLVERHDRAIERTSTSAGRRPGGGSDTTTIFSLAGALSFGGTAGVGAGIDVEVLTKSPRRDRATRSGGGHGDVVIDAASSEKLTSVAVGVASAVPPGSTSRRVSVIDITNDAFIANAATSADGTTIAPAAA